MQWRKTIPHAKSQSRMARCDRQSCGNYAPAWPNCGPNMAERLWKTTARVCAASKSCTPSWAANSVRRCSAVRTLRKKRAKLPLRVPVAQVANGAVVRLAAERQHLSNLLKMVAYQAECDLVQLVQPYYRRAEDEGRTLIQSALASAADIEVTENELQVRLMPLSSPHRTRAMVALCDDSTSRPQYSPEQKLVLRFTVAIADKS